jgi:hypothetical protein
MCSQSASRRSASGSSLVASATGGTGCTSSSRRDARSLPFALRLLLLVLLMLLLLLLHPLFGPSAAAPRGREDGASALGGRARTVDTLQTQRAQRPEARERIVFRC